jgi:aminopeptidase N
MPSLTRTEAADRAALLAVDEYDLDLDLTGATGDGGFRSVTTIRFRAVDPEVGTFVEVRPARLRSARLNGRELDPSTLRDGRLPLPGLAGENELVVDADMAYSNTGEGLHRFVDPADGRTYLYQMSFLDHAPRLFACFDQPDLKAPVTLRVTAPPDWTVAGNGRLVTAAAGRWEFARTEPLATYFVTMIAGPYHVLREEHDGVPLALYSRQSLAQHLNKDADEIFEITRNCLDRFHELFGVRYPFGDYGQAFVPEFNAGAMENPGLVTIRDDFIFRSAVTDSERELRATTIAHEMAHMWFGDLVTMRWWDDLWLNESFAEYLGVRVTAEATRFRHSWTTFAIKRKSWGYAADQRPSTHPVAPEEVTDAAEALLNFDGISYAKGAAALRQLVAWLGEEAFLAGLRGHFAAYRFGNATLSDLFTRLTAAGGRDLTDWARAWLRRAQVNTLLAEVSTDGAGRYASVAVRQTAPPDHPTLRPHRLGVGVYDLDGDVAPPGAAGELAGPAAPARPARRRLSVEAEIAPAPLSPVRALAGVPVGDLLLINDGDLTYAKVRLDDASAAAVPRVLPALTDPLARAVLWVSTLDSVTDAERPVSDLVELVVTALPTETNVMIVEDVLRLTRLIVDRYLPPAARADALARLAHGCELLMSGAEPGGSLQLAAARTLITATGPGEVRLADWLAGVGVPSGLAVDADLRWRARYRQVVLGEADAGAVAGELTGDRSATGEQWAARCRAAMPEAEAKRRAWDVLVADTSLSARLVEETAQGFWQPEQADLTEEYVPRYFADMPAAFGRRTTWVAEQVARSAYPVIAVRGSTRDAAAALLKRDDLPPGLRRAVVDSDDDLGRALSSRTRFPG